MQTTIMRCDLRWMLRKDLAEVVEIDRLAFDIGWDAEVFLAALKQRNCIGMVCEVGDTIVGEMVYELNRCVIDVLTFAVHPDYWGSGYGTAMMDKLKGKLHGDRRTTLRYIASEHNETAHLFLKANDFHAIAVCREWCEHPWHGPEDGYVFEFTI